MTKNINRSRKINIINKSLKRKTKLRKRYNRQKKFFKQSGGNLESPKDYLSQIREKKDSKDPIQIDNWKDLSEKEKNLFIELFNTESQKEEYNDIKNKYVFNSENGTFTIGKSDPNTIPDTSKKFTATIMNNNNGNNNDNKTKKKRRGAESEQGSYFEPSDEDTWLPKDKTICEDFIKKLQYQAKLTEGEPPSGDLYKVGDLENTDLHGIFRDMYKCLPEKISERTVMPVLAMFPSSNYVTSIPFKETIQTTESGKPI